MDIIEGFGLVKWHCEIPAGACVMCVHKLKGMHTREIIKNINKYWEGLCLDSMDTSRPRNGDIHDDYWMHNEKMRWSENCRITHARNTWYHSFMGHPEIMTRFMKEQQEKKQEARKQEAREEIARRHQQQLSRRSEKKPNESI